MSAFNRSISGDVPNVPMFHRDVSIAGRNNLAVTRLALEWAIDPAGA